MMSDEAENTTELGSTDVDADQISSILEKNLWDDAGPSPNLSLGIEDDDSSPGEERKRERREGGSISSIEDLYVRYPEMGRGEWKLRVTRTEPKQHRGHAIGGFVDDVFERMSQSEFAERFGGGVYLVALMRPTTLHEGTTADYKTVREIKMRLSGEPVVKSDMPLHYEGSNSSSNSKVEVTRLQLEERERIRLHEEKKRAEEKADRLQRDLMPNFYETTRKVVNDLSGMKEAQVEFWKSEVERLRGETNLVRQELQKEVNEKDAALKKAHEEILTLKQAATATTLQIESRVVTEQREAFKQRIDELKEQSNAAQKELRDRWTDERQRMNEEFNRKLQDLMTQQNNERSQAVATSTQERERLRADANERVTQLLQQKQSEMDGMRQTYESRISDLRLATDRELQALRDATAREIESVRQSERAQASIVRETAEMRKEAVKAEEARLRQELSDLRRDNTELRDRLDQERAAKHKDLPTAIREAREMASHLGLVDPSEAERPEPEQSTMSQFVGLARQAFDSAPQIMDKIMQARKEQQDAVLQAQAIQAQQMQMQQAQAQQAMAMQARQARQLPAPSGQSPQAQAQRPAPQRYAPPSRPAQAGPQSIPFGAAPVATPGSPVPFAPPPVVMGSPVQPAEAAAPAPMQVEQDAPPTAEASPNGLTLPAIEQAPADETMSQETGNMIVMFFQKLESAIENKVLSPETFALGVIDEIGHEQTAMLLRQFSPTDIVETAQQLSPDTRIATRDGQRFVAELWRIGGQKVAAAGF